MKRCQELGGVSGYTEWEIGQGFQVFFKAPSFRETN